MFAPQSRRRPTSQGRSLLYQVRILQAHRVCFELHRSFRSSSPSAQPFARSLQVSHAFEATLAQIAQSTLSHARASDSTVCVSLPLSSNLGLTPPSTDDPRLWREAFSLSSAAEPSDLRFHSLQGLSDSSHLDQRLELEAATLPSAERPVIWSFYQQQPISVHFSTVVGALFHYIHHLVSRTILHERASGIC